MKAILMILLWLPLAVGCKKKNPEPQLPPATQEGKNTFGCLVNGKVWLPEGRTSTFSSNLSILYEPPSFKGGGTSIEANRYRKGEIDQTLALGVDSVAKYGTGSYRLQCVINPPYPTGGVGNFQDHIRGCEYYCNRDGTVLLEGNCKLTKLDLANKIVSGTFAFTLAKLGCDTIKITDGRFDMKLY